MVTTRERSEVPRPIPSGLQPPVSSLQPAPALRTGGLCRQKSHSATKHRRQYQFRSLTISSKIAPSARAPAQSGPVRRAAAARRHVHSSSDGSSDNRAQRRQKRTTKGHPGDRKGTVNGRHLSGRSPARLGISRTARLIRRTQKAFFVSAETDFSATVKNRLHQDAQKRRERVAPLERLGSNPPTERGAPTMTRPRAQRDNREPRVSPVRNAPMGHRRGEALKTLEDPSGR
jgi:hypothetical protein